VADQPIDSTSQALDRAAAVTLSGVRFSAIERRLSERSIGRFGSNAAVRDSLLSAMSGRSGSFLKAGARQQRSVEAKPVVRAETCSL
jgi:hypothetical protein